MRWLAKTFVGIFVAIGILAVGGYFAANYLITQFTKLPERPTFPNDDPNYRKSQVKASAKPNPSNSPASDKNKSEPSNPESKSEKPLPPGAFEGKVIQPIGLVLRQSASLDGAPVGGISFNEKVVVLESSPDGNWQKVRLLNSDREGWVKGGNIDKVQ